MQFTVLKYEANKLSYGQSQHVGQPGRIKKQGQMHSKRKDFGTFERSRGLQRKRMSGYRTITGLERERKRARELLATYSIGCIVVMSCVNKETGWRK